MDRIQHISEQAFELFKHFEGVRTTAYLCQAGVWTIGIGSTRYPGPEGKRVKKGDHIDEATALTLFRRTIGGYEKSVDDITRDDVTQSQFDALVSLCYNIGAPGLADSTVLRLVNMRCDDTDKLLKAFLMWDKIRKDGRLVPSDGLERRRRAEWHLYTKGELFFYEADFNKQ